MGALTSKPSFNMKFNQRKRRQSLPLDEPKAKRLVKVSPRPLQLVDLNEDVLREIFSYLDVQDLVNVVHSDKVFLNVIRRTFKRKYNRTCIPIPFFSRTEYLTARQYLSRNAELLRCFGETMSSLQISLDNNNSIDQRIFLRIHTHCRKTLTELKILHPMIKFDRDIAFPKVRKLTFSHGCLNLTPSEIVQWFPSLENLVFDSMKDVGWLSNLGQKITSWKCLSLDSSNKSFSGHFYRNLPPSVHDEVAPSHKLASVKLNIENAGFGHSTYLEHLKFPNDRIAHVEIYFDQLTEQICDYVAGCVNIKTLKIGTNYYDQWNENNKLEESGWMNLNKFDCLRRLEIWMPVFRVLPECFCKFALEMIGPFLKPSKSLTRIIVRCPIYNQESELHDHNFDPIRSSIDFKIWSFEIKISLNEIMFTLAKVAA